MSTHKTAIDQQAGINIKKWLLAEHAESRRKQSDHELSVGPFVTISREAGAGGSEIARRVGEQLQWDVLDREILDVMAEKYGMPHTAVEFLDEHRAGLVEDWFTTWFTGRNYSQSAYNFHLLRILLLAAQYGKVVIVGRGAQFVLPAHRGISVRILAPLEYRVKQTMVEQQKSRADALKLVKKLDKQHEDFTRSILQHNAADPHMYDLVVNVAKLGVSDAVTLIVNATRSWMSQANSDGAGSLQIP